MMLNAKAVGVSQVLRMCCWLAVSAACLCLPGRSQAAIQAFVQFTQYGGAVPAGDSTVAAYPASQGWFQLPSMSVDVLQTLSIGSTTGGTGAGKITFNPLTIQKLVNSLSPTLFLNAAAGTPYKFVTMVFCKPPPSAGKPPVEFFKITLGLVAVKTQSWILNDTATDLAENVSFDYGGMAVTFTPQNPDGTAGLPFTQGWNRVRNASWDGIAVIN